MGKGLHVLLVLILISLSFVNSAKNKNKIIFEDEGEEFVEPKDDIPKQDVNKKPSVYENIYDTSMLKRFQINLILESRNPKKSVYEQMYKKEDPKPNRDPIPTEIISDLPVIPPDTQIPTIEPPSEPQFSHETQIVLGVLFTLALAIAIKYIFFKSPSPNEPKSPQNELPNSPRKVDSPKKVETPTKSKAELSKPSKNEETDEIENNQELIEFKEESSQAVSKNDTAEFKKNLNRKSFQYDMIAHSNSVLSTIDLSTLSDEHKLLYAQNTLKLTEVVAKNRKLEFEETKQKEKEKKFLYQVKKCEKCSFLTF